MDTRLYPDVWPCRYHAMYVCYVCMYACMHACALPSWQWVTRHRPGQPVIRAISGEVASSLCASEA